MFALEIRRTTPHRYEVKSLKEANFKLTVGQLPVTILTDHMRNTYATISHMSDYAVETTRIDCKI